eukprot:gnl/TRDRNA2_/TRDRNA2_172046_c2_seq3.p1 gnl/TRDRNA2_/TRDRNA2_172046_c2~~gnl/TRDRNA2_/TRDRNA2_172046_c2_seq3.p1  ORF type:complete len:431 (+),score=30.69 gnl/TRDRNA2_/TRDRNA2_172046_c2_seq3:88-1380(+)
MNLALVCIRFISFPIACGFALLLPHAPPNKCSADSDDLVMPNPYTEEYLKNLYDVEYYGGNPPKFEGGLFLTRMRREIAISEYSTNSTNMKAFRKLVDDGLAINHFGMDFSNLYRRRYCPKGHCTDIDGRELDKDTDVQHLWDVYYSTRVSSFIKRNDVPEMFISLFSSADPYGFSAKQLSMLKDFRRDGFVLIDQWSDLDLDTHSMEAKDRLAKFVIEPSSSEAHDLIHNATIKDTQFLQMGTMRSLDRLVDKHSFMMKLASAYLGGEAEAHTTSAFTLKGSATKTTYSNGPFHHDGCGRRLKAWIFHEDVTMNRHPTMIAAGTQHNQWFPATEYFVGKNGVNKLNEDMVQQEFGDRIKPMVGKKGGGFIFDTNAIHGALMRGVHQDRHTTSIEMSTKRHMTLPRMPLGPDDGYLSAWGDGICPSFFDR